MRNRSFLAVLIYVVVALSQLFNYANFKQFTRHSNIRYDMFGYYSYLPMAFIYGDTELKFAQNPQFADADWSWTVPTPTGKPCIRYTAGVAILQSPFFLIAHAVAPLSGYPADGYSQPYKLAMGFGAIFYGALGLWLLGLTLRRLYSENVVALCLLGLGLGTNLFFYTVHEGLMSHAYSFCLFAAMLYGSARWLETERKGWVLFLGLIGGWIVLLRPTNALFLLLPFLYGVRDVADFRARWAFFWRQRWAILGAGAMAVVAVSPQLIYWKLCSGQWLFMSYMPDERLYLTHPMIYEGLLGFRKGWFIYTPLMGLSLLGMLAVRRYAPQFGLFLAIYIPLNIWVVMSWFCWWYGGGFGLRAFIESSTAMAIGLGAGLSWASRWRWTQGLAGLLLAGCIWLNLFQTYQYRRCYIHWEAMTAEAYWAVFGRWEISAEEVQRIQNELCTAPRTIGDLIREKK